MSQIKAIHIITIFKKCQGPFLFPVIGNLPQMMWHSRVLNLPRKALYDGYRRAYGKVYSIKMGPFP